MICNFSYLKSLQWSITQNRALPGEILPPRGGVLQVALVQAIGWEEEFSDSTIANALIISAKVVATASAAIFDAILYTMTATALTLKLFTETLFEVAIDHSFTDTFRIGSHLICAVQSLFAAIISPPLVAFSAKRALEWTDTIGLTDHITETARSIDLSSYSVDFYSPLSIKTYPKLVKAISHFAPYHFWRSAKKIAAIGSKHLELSLLSSIVLLHFGVEAYGYRSPITLLSQIDFTKA